MTIIDGHQDGDIMNQEHLILLTNNRFGLGRYILCTGKAEIIDKVFKTEKSYDLIIKELKEHKIRVKVLSYPRVFNTREVE